MVTQYEVDPGNVFRNAVVEAARRVDDLTIPFTLIKASWFRSNKAIFALQGPGKYVDLSPAYKAQKKKAVGFVYPILRRTGALERSITVQGDSNSIAVMPTKKSLDLGTRIPYGVFHQKGTKKMPQRPFILIGAEQVSPPEINRRREAWIAVIQDYILQVTGGLGEVKT